LPNFFGANAQQLASHCHLFACVDEASRNRLQGDLSKELPAQAGARQIAIQQRLAKKSTSLIHVIWIGMQPAMMRRGKRSILNFSCREE